ncbi:hypothetical protein FACS1894190_03390 [Spirochaetia bacterium]|nr:hypothetical protein FACS1894190_03390 [Spirochaetia bacterium]
MKNRKMVIRVEGLLILILGLSTLCGSLFGQAHDKSYYIGKAMYERYQGKFNEAYDDLMTALKIDPNDPQIYVDRGFVQEKRGNYAEAYADYQRALALNPYSAQAQHNLTALAKKTNTANYAAPLPPQQISALAAPVNQNVNSYQSAPALSYSYNTAPAQTGYSQTQSLTSQEITYPPVTVRQTRPGTAMPSVTPTYRNIGGFRQSVTGASYPQAAASVYPAASYNEYPVGSYTGKSGSYSSYNQARQDGLVPVTTVPPSTFTDNNYTAKTSLSLKTNTQRTSVVFDKYIDPITASFNDHGVELCNLGNYSDAIKQFDEAIKKYEGYAIAYNNRGVAYALSGDTYKALEDFNHALRLNPYYYDAQYNRERTKGRIS